MRAADRDTGPERPASRQALVKATDDRHGDSRPASSRPSAMFLAHLIAVAQQAPQTRQRRRAEPDEAKAAYREASTPSAPSGQAVCR